MIPPCSGGMAGTVEDELRSDVSCLGSGLRLAKTEVGTRSFISVEAVEAAAAPDAVLRPLDKDVLVLELLVLVEEGVVVVQLGPPAKKGE